MTYRSERTLSGPHGPSVLAPLASITTHPRHLDPSPLRSFLAHNPAPRYQARDRRPNSYAASPSITRTRLSCSRTWNRSPGRPPPPIGTGLFCLGSSIRLTVTSYPFVTTSPASESTR